MVAPRAACVQGIPCAAVLRIARFHRNGSVKIIAGGGVVAAAETDDTIKIMPFRIVQRYAVQYCLRFIQRTCVYALPHTSEFSRKIAGITTAVISGITAGGSAGAAARITSESAAGISVLGSGAVFAHVCYCVIRLVDLLQLVVCKILQVTVLIAIGMIFFN